MKSLIRLVKELDYADMLAIYAPYVRETALSFEYEAPSESEFALRIATLSKHYPCLVFEHEGKVAGYCYGNVHRGRIAYQWSVECAIYVSESFHHKGVAATLYDCLFEILRLQGFINVYAGVAVPGSKSDRFHNKLFRHIGTLPKIGYKFGKWHDLKWYEYNLAEHLAEPRVPVSITDMMDSPELKEILISANRKINATSFT